MDMKAWLSNPFTREDITAAIFQINPLGSPGPDGFPAQFYQKNWEVMGDQVCNFALNFLNHGGSLNEVNDTFITLIPKVQSPKRVVDYIPISLCNVLYKVVSKTMANRLKHILPQIIAPNQSAFVLGRLISDNTLVAYEVLHSMNSRMKGKKGFMALKLDMSKAYDRVEWKFIEAIMIKMAFPAHWIHIIQACLTSVSYSILVNGEPQNKVVPSRGLRQGDPLSPYLFILCAEALSSLVRHAEACGSLTPMAIGRGPVKVNHLFFANDSLLFCQAKYEKIKCVLNILVLYEKGLGHVLNKDKSAIYFSKNTALMTQQQILQLTGVQSISSFEKYLGLPTLVRRKKIASFHSLIDRTWSRVTNWRTKFLSTAGNEILLKAVLQAIPTYAMWMFLIPASITSKLNQILRKFWWGFNEDSSKIQWVNWEYLSGRKDMGGLRFLSDIIDPQQKIWQESLLSELFTHQEIEGIKAIPISLGGREDKLTWQFTPNGCFTIKSGYYIGKELEREQVGETSGIAKDCQVWRSIWKLKVPPATKMFIWRACSEVLPTIANLKRRKVVNDSICLICKREHETSGHALWGCSGAQDVWCQGPKKVQKFSYHSDLIFNIWAELIGKLEPEELNEVAVTMRMIWARRNDVLHGKAFKHPNEVIAQARTELSLHNEALQKEVGAIFENMARVHIWTKPAVGSLKVNWDATVQTRIGRIGIGEIGVRHFCLEGDSKQVVDQMNQDSPNWSIGGCFMSDAKTVLNSAAVWSISHVYREANMAAHRLAQAAFEYTEDMYDIETCPSCILHVVTKEMRQ
ncbi:uncharacterized protein LOC121245775 [Juglans microcarpa x Juglans regia]|uniref:uncharacterized protein LOC121245775 n=1 Tax=Juglans microcarpa x Juglans regia TaxID=2249226 RepID=UPI001B7E9848|nr:uncharacterized protein LOC121245775 [Juglans microcarpa x Juglans regia]